MNTPLYMWLAGGAAFLVGLSKGGLPAIGMLAVPLMSLVMPPVDAAVMLLPIYVISDVMGVYLYRRDYSAPNLRILIPASLLGVFIGWLTASVVSDRAITFLIGAMGVAFCLNVWLRKQGNAVAQAPSIPKGGFWGMLAGFTSFISHAGAPPFQVYMLSQRLPKAEFAGTATILFAVINASKIVPYQFLRPYSLESLRSAAVLVPFALVGAISGAYLTRCVADVWFYRIVQVSLFGVSLKLIADSLKGLWA
ncbi:sulfite exporter TauE/SafE family protein [Rhodoferax sp. GW822-FHT02A01]|uniref:sulfite exporter TauE/SafE family protein n=1 Tax=Rhodoferax sp. GW822-FHT02A01 TaxID=3141537 RepID=UPI00315D9AA6